MCEMCNEDITKILETEIDNIDDNNQEEVLQAALDIINNGSFESPEPTVRTITLSIGEVNYDLGVELTQTMVDANLPSVETSIIQLNEWIHFMVVNEEFDYVFAKNELCNILKDFGVSIDMYVYDDVYHTDDSEMTLTLMLINDTLTLLNRFRSDMKDWIIKDMQNRLSVAEESERNLRKKYKKSKTLLKTIKKIVK